MPREISRTNKDKHVPGQVCEAQLRMAIGFSYEKSNQVLWGMTWLMLPVTLLIAALVWGSACVVRMTRRVHPGCRVNPCDP